MICLPDNYQKYDLPLHQDAVRVYIEVHIKDIPKVITPAMPPPSVD